MKAIFFSFTFFILVCTLTNTQAQSLNNPNIDYGSFIALSQELEGYRQKRLIDITTFNQMAEEDNTIILDTRSKEAFEDIHLAGAVHLNFSDFTAKKLAKIIPDKNTRILIYCNNNFVSPMEALTNKSPGLALNIPTFINLYGYGYHNIYELKDYLDQQDERVHFVVQTQ